jgi:hypothetical protein
MGSCIDRRLIQFDEAGTNPQIKNLLRRTGVYNELPCSLPTSSLESAESKWERFPSTVD